ncbi:MAG: hypothetical protein D3924_04545 [Candidatus Electrothrix sp. AR4]|nr:hypothetical protein [Candidatus Electrothrix sp. AR4]
MEQIAEAFSTPTGTVALLSVGVALFSVILQGLKAAIDIIGQARNRKLSISQRQIEYVSSLFSMIDGLPIDDGRKIVLKATLLETNIPVSLPDELKKEIEDVLR